ncbi:MAG: putative molybdenum carrier protein [Planctomycetaceae bacterium]|nr:putative molybdenum carrier protein [Planctomycetaceae bacterium]
MPDFSIIRIVSGGQTGVDRAALEVALQLGLPCGGWCPRGRRAEDGRIPDRFPLTEASSDRYDVRTRLNVEESDGTLVLTMGDPVGGTALTVATAERVGKPLLVLDLDIQPRPDLVREWLSLHSIGTLNIAGPRESTSPGIGRLAAEFLTEVLSEWKRPADHKSAE